MWCWVEGLLGLLGGGVLVLGLLAVLHRQQSQQAALSQVQVASGLSLQQALSAWQAGEQAVSRHPLLPLLHLQH